METIGSALLLSLLPLLVSRWYRVAKGQRPDWLSFADGISISYVFLALLPKIVHGFEQLRESVGARDYPFVPLLVGLMVFYGLARLVEEPSLSPRQRVTEPLARLRVRIHIASFSLYKGLIGYFLIQMSDIVGILLFTVAMGMHFLVVDFRLLKIHESIYSHIGRWILSTAILLGWGLGWTIEISPAIAALLMGFVAGGIVLIVLQEEFSIQHPGTFYAFLAGAVLYSSLLLAF